MAFLDRFFSADAHKALPMVSSEPALPPFHFSPNKLILVSVTVIVTGAVALGIYWASAKGNPTVLQQRFLGEVKLRDGKHSARSVKELNQLSWNNGLSILESLDILNSDLDRLSEARMMPNSSSTDIKLLEERVFQQYQVLNAQIQDQKKLVETAHIFNTQSLMTPEYSEALTKTKSRFNAVHASGTDNQAVSES